VEAIGQALHLVGRMLFLIITPFRVRIFTITSLGG